MVLRMSSNNSATRNFIPMANKYDRVVLLVDMDCFYCQVEEKLDPSLKHQPLAVVQYNAWRGGGIIAVNYAARAKGVTRHMRGDEAKEQCPDIKLVKVPNIREKADLTKYREAGKDVANVLQRFTPLLERASVDEAYLDITDAVNKRLQEMNDGSFILQPQELANTYACGFPTIGEFVTTVTSSFTNPPTADNDLYRNFNVIDDPAVRQSNIRLLIAASIASEIRAAVKADTTYECSAGIAHNKILAKLACGMNKPNKQTLLPLAQIPLLFETLPISKIKGLGAKFGEEICERMGVRYLGQLLKFTEAELQRKFDEKNGSWLYNISRGIDLETVTPRFYSKSIGCCKKFPGRNNITGVKTLQHWLNELANEINDRLEKDICENNRRAKQMVVNFTQEIDGAEISSSRSAPLQSYDTEFLAKTSLETIKGNTKQFFRAGSESVLNNPIKFLGISVGKFETISNSQNNIQEMFAQQAAKKKRLSADDKQEPDTTAIGSISSVNITANSIQKVSKENEKTNESPIQIPKEKKKHDVRSFFLNAQTSQTETKSPSGQNSFGEHVNGTSSFTRNETQLKADQENDCTLTNKRISTCKDNVAKYPPKSFFVEVLKQKNTEILRELTTTTDNFDNDIDPTKDSMDIFETGGTQNDCNELNDLINDINTMQNEENENKVISTSKLFQLDSNLSYNETIITDNVSNTISKTLHNKRKYDTICDSNELNLKDYRAQYAEFATPEFRPELLQFSNCLTCGAKILNDPLSVQTHQDHHFAQELSQKQRDEYRNEIRTKINASKSPPNTVANRKSKKIQQLNNKKSFSADITKFLKPPTSSVPLSHSNQNQEPKFDLTIVEICDICNVPVKCDDILEHKDFHMAKELQRKLNQLEVNKVQVLKKPISEISRKSMNSSISESPRQGKFVTKPITKFFTQPQI